MMKHVQTLLNPFIDDLHVLHDLSLNQFGLLWAGLLHMCKVVQGMQSILLFHTNVVLQVF